MQTATAMATVRRFPQCGFVGLVAALLLAALALASPVATVRAATDPVTNCNASGGGSLADVLAAAGAGDTITFAQDCTVTLTGTLTLTRNVTLDGGGHSVTIQGNDTFTLLHINSGVSVNLIGLTFTRGKATIKNSRTELAGGAIFAGGPLTVTGCTFTANSAAEGGAIDSETGPLTVTDSAFSANYTFDDGGGENGGGAIYYGPGGAANRLTVIGSTFTNNHADIYGADSGAISANGPLTMIGSTFSGNTSSFSGGAITVAFNASFISDSTFTGNSVNGTGSAIIAYNGLTIVNTTIAGNSTGQGGAIDADQPFANVTITNSIVSGNNADCSSTSGGRITDGGYNLENGSTSCGFTNHAQTGAPNLGPLTNNGGPTPTLLPGSGSAAIGNGNLSVCQNTNVSTGGSGPYDQRGALRIQNGACSIGAVEPGNSQLQDTTALTVTANGAAVANGGNVPYGASVTLTATVVGARGETLPGSETYTFKDGTTTLGTGTRAVNRTTASDTLTANLAPGMHTFSVNAYPGGSGYDPSPTPNTVTVNVTPIACVVTSTADTTSAPGTVATLRDAVTVANAGACTSNTITFGPAFGTAQTITLTSGELALTHTVTITGPGSALLTVARSTAMGTPQFRILQNVPGNTASVSGLTITGGDTPYDGGGILSQGDFALSDVVLRGNTSGNSGGGIEHNGNVTLTLTNVTVSGNSAAQGGGIDVYQATLNATNLTVSGNTATVDGGGIANGGGTLTLTNATVSGNVTTGNGSVGGGIASSGTSTLTNATVSGNTAGSGGGFYNNSGTLAATRTIIAGNTGGDLGGGGITGMNVNNLTSGAPLLAPLGNYGGTTQTRPPLPGSPAIDAGGAGCTATDQRGVTRPLGSACDIGSVESRGFTVSTLVGNNQSAVVNTAFANPVGFTVSGTMGEPVAGGQITYTITPGTGGASAAFGTAPASCTNTSATVTVCTLPAGGVTTSPPFTANSVPGAFTIVATASGVPNTTFNETNTPGPAVSFTVSGCTSPVVAGTACTVTVTAKDAGGNTATGYTGTVKITSSDPQAVLPPNATLMNGVGTFTVTLKTAGSQSITATDTTTPSITGSQTGIVVNAGTAATFTVSGCPATVLSGTPCTVAVTAKDASGNTATGYTGTVAITSSDSRAVLPANATLMSGVGSFTVTLRTPGMQTIIATDTVTPSITGAQTGITVTGSAPTAANDSYSVTTGLTLTVPAATGVLANDTRGNPTATITSNTQPAHGTLLFTPADGSFVYTPTAGYVGADSFTYTLTNSVGTSTATVALTVTGTAPTAANDSYTVTTGLTLTVPTATGVFANDTKGNPTATITANTQPAHGTLMLNTGDGSFTYTPTTGYVSNDSFTYTLTNSVGTSTGTVSITVTAATVTGLTTTAPTGSGSGNTGTATAPAMNIGGKLTLTTTAAFNNGTTGTTGGLSYTSSNPGVATVDPTTGLVTALTAGTTTLTVTGPNGSRTTLTVTVTGAAGTGLMPQPQPMTHTGAATAAATPLPQPGRHS